MHGLVPVGAGVSVHESLQSCSRPLLFLAPRSRRTLGSSSKQNGKCQRGTVATLSHCQIEAQRVLIHHLRGKNTCEAPEMAFAIWSQVPRKLEESCLSQVSCPKAAGVRKRAQRREVVENIGVTTSLRVGTRATYQRSPLFIRFVTRTAIIHKSVFICSVY
jgi:hypothetical protein